MKIIIYLVILLSVMGCTKKNYLQSEMVQLSKPVMSVSEFFFDTPTTFTVADPEEGARIIYVFNGVATAEYEGPKEFRHSFQITANAIGEGYITSEEASIEAVRLPLRSPVVSIVSDREPSDKYNAGGLDILIDRKKGEHDFSKGWLGYGGDSISYTLSIEERSVYMVKVSVLRNQNAWIFAPEKVEVYHEGKLLAEAKVEDALTQKDDGFVIVSIPIERIDVSNLEVKVIAHSALPDWHPGAGNKPWIFVDEILIY